MESNVGLLDKLGKIPVWRRCPAGKFHRVSIDHPECGHTGRVLDWCEEYQRWVPNPSKDVVIQEMFERDEEFAIDREAREMLEEALRDGNLQPAIDYRRLLMNQNK
jgi:hypothetical protein